MEKFQAFLMGAGFSEKEAIKLMSKPVENCRMAGNEILNYTMNIRYLLQKYFKEELLLDGVISKEKYQDLLRNEPEFPTVK